MFLQQRKLMVSWDAFGQVPPVDFVTDEILHLFSVSVKPGLKYWVQFKAPQYMRDMDTLERVYQRGRKMMKRLEHLSCEERLGEPDSSEWKRESSGGFHQYP